MEFEIIKKLFDIRDNLNGISENEILNCERRLGIKFPKALRKYYQELGKHFKLNQSHNNLISLEKLEVYDNYLVFLIENQGVVHWGIKIEDIDNFNPKVYKKIENEWELDSESLIKF